MLLRLEKLIDNVVVDFVEEETTVEPNRWRYVDAMNKLSFSGEEQRFYIDGEQQLLKQN